MQLEFTLELFWKLLQYILEDKGVMVQYPKDVLKEAYRGELIDDESVWLRMLKDQNLTSHTYDEELADVIYRRVQLHTPFLRGAYEALKLHKGIPHHALT